MWVNYSMIIRRNNLPLAPSAPIKYWAVTNSLSSVSFPFSNAAAVAIITSDVCSIPTSPLPYSTTTPYLARCFLRMSSNSFWLRQTPFPWGARNGRFGKLPARFLWQVTYKWTIRPSTSFRIQVPCFNRNGSSWKLIRPHGRDGCCLFLNVFKDSQRLKKFASSGLNNTLVSVFLCSESLKEFQPEYRTHESPREVFPLCRWGGAWCRSEPMLGLQQGQKAQRRPRR